MEHSMQPGQGSPEQWSAGGAYWRTGLQRLACASVLGCAVPLATAWADEPAQPDPAPAEVRFNSAFLSGAADGIDLSVFERGNPVVAGVYRVDVHVNGRWVGRRDLEFQAGRDGRATACLTLPVLEELGIDSGAVLADANPEGVPCREAAQWMEDARARFDQATLRYDLTIPQAFLRRTPRGYVDPALWDPGINAGYIGYHFNALDSHNRGVGGRGTRRSAYLGLNSGLNLGAWQFRHDSSLSWTERGGSHWEGLASYVRRPLPGVRGVLVLGDAHTSGELFDSVAYRGISLASDDRMLPDSLRGYAPVVRGIAETAASVEIRQNGQLIHTVSVAPGGFVIDDLYPTGYGGDLEVTVVEADGRRRMFNVPYGSVAQMLRPGSSRYAVMAGQVRNRSLSNEPAVLQGTYQRGLANGLTVYGGTALSDGYASLLYGAGVSTPLGAFAVDATHARTSLDGDAALSGSSLRLGYSNLVGATGTQVSVAAYRYSTRNFLGLQDAILVHDLLERGADPARIARQRSQFQLTVSQPLGHGRGAFHLTGVAREFWGDPRGARDFQFGYNNAWRRLGYSVSAVRSVDPMGEADTRFLLSFSLPLGGPRHPVSVTGELGVAQGRHESSRIGIAGSVGPGHALGYGLTASDARDTGTSVVASADYRSGYTAVSGSYARADDHRQATVGASGTVVLHAGGATFAPQRSDTMVLVEAQGARGARVHNAPGVRVDSRGHAVVPYLSPYRLNTVTLDPGGIAHDVELQGTSATIAPYAGAIGRLRFETRHGHALLVQARRAAGGPVPFGARVLDAEGQVVGMVGQGGIAYVRTPDAAGSLEMRWGAAEGQHCRLEYAVPAQAVESGTPFIRVEADCR